MMEKLVVLFVLVAVAFSNVQSLHHDQHVHEEDAQEYLHDREFHMWIYEYYEGDKEHWDEMYPMWKKNAEFVKEHNSLGHLSYKLSLNKFAHLNISDMVKPELFAQHHKRKEVHFEKHPIPPMVDWREKGFIPPVKDHGELGDSHLCPILDSIDAMWAISHDHLELASFDEFKDCCWKEGELHLWSLSHYECVVHLGGLAKEKDYKSPDHMCLSHSFPPFVKLSGAGYVKPKDEKALAMAVAIQPVAVAVDASHQSFQFYKEGIYYEPHCSSEELNHAMLLVGYGMKDGKHYWIVKNSWGEKWGMDGYMLMAKDMDNHCGIASKAMYPF